LKSLWWQHKELLFCNELHKWKYWWYDVVWELNSSELTNIYQCLLLTKIVLPWRQLTSLTTLLPFGEMSCP
jgi:hypothetical protein